MPSCAAKDFPCWTKICYNMLILNREDHMFQGMLRHLLDNLSYGLPLELTVVHCGGRVQRVGRKTPKIPEVILTFRHPAAYRRILLDHSLGFGECYAEGLIEVQGMYGLYHLLRAFYESAQGLHHWLNALPALARFGNWPGTFNDAETSGRNAKAHYDANDEIVRLITGRNHVYSCALFLFPDMTLEQAQMAKLDYLLRKADCQPGLSLLDIGCGYGALIRRATKKYGMVAYGTTLSENQQRVGQELIAAEGLQNSCHIHECDYRDLECRYDRVISVGMFEHVGRRNWPDFFRAVCLALAPDGVFVLHTICRNRRRAVWQP
ncbi:MAG: class I SAM-dependent methyltransferase, partial [Patescibacteria group bacterium]|nr:class I SAM-dependent methyltransferase [Patescibacteria group bacterium]